MSSPSEPPKLPEVLRPQFAYDRNQQGNNRLLLIVRAGKNSIHRSWMYTLHGLADVALSLYDDTDFSDDPAAIYHRCKGGKMQGIYQLFAENPWLLNMYDYFWLLDDDLHVPTKTVMVMKEMLAAFQPDLSTAPISFTSFNGRWGVMIRNENMLLRTQDCIEMLAPLMSREFLVKSLPYFPDNFSGWGQEWIWQRIMQDMGISAFVFDSVTIDHTRPYALSSTRQNMAGMKTSEQEMEEFMQRHNLDPNFTFRLQFGVENDSHKILFGNELSTTMAAGYREVIPYNNDIFLKCVLCVTKYYQPIVTREATEPTPFFKKFQDNLQRYLASKSSAGLVIPA
jgi:hypothetical protein